MSLLEDLASIFLLVKTVSDRTAYLLQRPIPACNNDHVCVFQQFQKFLGLALIIGLKYKRSLW